MFSIEESLDANLHSHESNADQQDGPASVLDQHSPPSQNYKNDSIFIKSPFESTQ